MYWNVNLYQTLIYYSNFMENAKPFSTKLKELYESGNFELRKWALNEDSDLINLSDLLRATSLMHERPKDQSRES